MNANDYIEWAGSIIPGDQAREEAAVARAGGRAVTSAVARFIEELDKPGQYSDPQGMRDSLAGKFGPDGLTSVWTNFIDPAGQEGAKRWRWIAQREAHVGRFPSYSGQEPTIFARLLVDAEAMLDWPIYRAALQADTYAALWGQASPAEEVVLDTLARCSGIVTGGLTPEESIPETPGYIGVDTDGHPLYEASASTWGEALGVDEGPAFFQTQEDPA